MAQLRNPKTGEYYGDPTPGLYTYHSNRGGFITLDIPGDRGTKMSLAEARAIQRQDESWDIVNPHEGEAKGGCNAIIPCPLRTNDPDGCYCMRFYK